jgi:hypothetical protein
VVLSSPASSVWIQPPSVFSPTIQATAVSPVGVSSVVVSQRPQVVSSVPVTRVYRAPTVVYQPTRQVVTRRPVVSGTVARPRYGYVRVRF